MNPTAEQIMAAAVAEAAYRNASYNRKDKKAQKAYAAAREAFSKICNGDDALMAAAMQAYFNS